MRSALCISEIMLVVFAAVGSALQQWDAATFFVVTCIYIHLSLQSED